MTIGVVTCLDIQCIDTIPSGPAILEVVDPSGNMLTAAWYYTGQGLRFGIKLSDNSLGTWMARMIVMPINAAEPFISEWGTAKIGDGKPNPLEDHLGVVPTGA